MSNADMMIWAINLYASLAEYAIPVAFAFGMCNLIVSSFFSVAFGGRLRIGGGKQ